MPKVKLTQTTVIGGEMVAKGKTVDASARDAHILIQMGKAELVEAKAKAKTADDDADNRAEGLTTDGASGLVQR